jgi:hypothetical protein
MGEHTDLWGMRLGIDLVFMTCVVVYYVSQDAGGNEPGNTFECTVSLPLSLPALAIE